MGGNRTYSGIALKFGAVAFARDNIEDGCQPSSVSARNAALEKSDILYDIGIDSGEEAEEVGRIIERCTIEKDQVLVGRSSPYILSSRSFTDRMDPLGMQQ